MAFENTVLITPLRRHPAYAFEQEILSCIRREFRFEYLTPGEGIDREYPGKAETGRQAGETLPDAGGGGSKAVHGKGSVPRGANCANPPVVFHIG